MAPKIAAFIITMIADIIAAIIILFTMLVAMNGYSESDSTWGIGAYALLAFFTTIATSLAASFLAGKLIAKQFNPLVSAIIAIFVFSITGLVLEIVCSLIGVGVAEIVRVNF